MKTAVLVFVSCLALCMQLHSIQSASIKHSMEDSGDYNSVLQQEHDAEYLKWVKHLKVGDVIFAKEKDLDLISSYVQSGRSQDDGTACFASFRHKAATPEDGPEKPVEDLIDEKSVSASDKSDSSQEDIESYECLTDVSQMSTYIYYYPEFGVGMLDNGCTAFLVGPYHALTLAECVYDNEERIWKDGLDFWRGRTRNVTLERMEWEETYIPNLYFEDTTESGEHNWALIKFKEEQSSPVWLTFQYCPDKCPWPYVTTYGYYKEGLYRKDCSVGKDQDCLKTMTMSCCHTQTITLNGGPVVDGYGQSSLSKTMPPVVGITMKSEESTNEDDPSELAFMFDSDIFWSICYFLAESQGTDELSSWEVCKKI